MQLHREPRNRLLWASTLKRGSRDNWSQLSNVLLVPIAKARVTYVYMYVPVSLQHDSKGASSH